MIISIDHGNSSIKTPSIAFTSGLVAGDGDSGFRSTDTICWNSKNYALTERRIAYLRDKTEDDRFFVLTLFAIAYELRKANIQESIEPIDVTLLVGLPPAHYSQLHAKFEQYFLHGREPIDFEFNGCYYCIRVQKVLSYPQAFAAAVTKYTTLKTQSVSYVIDIGGFTIDVLKLRYGKPDLSLVESFENGIITLHNAIISKCDSQYGRLLEASDIDEVISNGPTLLAGEVQQLIRQMTAVFLTDFFHFLRERGIDVSTGRFLFTGGGAILLRGMIDRSGKVPYAVYDDNIHSNAIGYQLLYQSEVNKNAE